MAFLDGYKHDIFVSYAHNDNKSYVESDIGWVKNLIKVLRTRVVELVGSDSVDIWMDYELRGNDAVTPTIMDELSQSAILLFASSESYLASSWCRNELNGFLNSSVGDRRAGSLQRLFMIQRDKIDRSRLPEALRDLIGYPFWIEEFGKSPIVLGYPTPDPKQSQYWSLLNKLSLEIKETLKILKNGGAESPLASVVIHLAEVTDDLELLRQEVGAFLEQAGIGILPKTYYPRDALSKFQDAIDADLKQSKLFVQLLSGVSGRKPTELPQGYPGLQFQRAQVAQKEILQWRSPALDINSVVDAEHRKLLKSHTVIAEGVEAFKERVKRRAFTRKVAPPSPPGKLIFVNTESGDRKIAQQIANCIMRKGFGFALSHETSIRKDLRERLHECDGAIIVYASSPAKWVERQQDYIRKFLQDIIPPPPVIAICESQHEKPDFVNYRYFQTIWFDTDVDCDVLEPFLEQVRSRSR
jgi:hypothetical protein